MCLEGYVRTEHRGWGLACVCMLACLRVSTGDWLCGRARSGHAGVSCQSLSVRRGGVGRCWAYMCLCALHVSAGDVCLPSL